MMSHVTDTFILASVAFEDKEKVIFEKINNWLDDNAGGQRFKRLDNNNSAYGGNKVFQASIWCGAFNYLGIEEFINFLRTIDFGDELIQVAYKDEHEDKFTLVDIARGDRPEADPTHP